MRRVRRGVSDLAAQGVRGVRLFPVTTHLYWRRSFPNKRVRL